MSLSRRTVTSLITTSGRQLEDWTADYRLFSMGRFDPEGLFDGVRNAILDDLGPDQPLVVAMDDTISRKKGRKVPGTSWRRDPLSPPFHPNFVWGRRFIQLSAFMPPRRDDAPGRAIPVDFVHAPTPCKPRAGAGSDAWTRFRHASRAQSLSRQGVARIQRLREKMTRDGAHDRPLLVAVDGSYTNGTVLKNLPGQTTIVGRIRRDARLHPRPTPEEMKGRGRTRRYGLSVVTPEGVRQDQEIEWQTAPIYAAGKIHEMRYKTVGPLLWRSAGADLPLRLIVIAPLAYRLSKKSKILYRYPAFLICTDPDLSVESVLKAYVSRWDIEVNFRDEKQLIGFDEAQVRTPNSARNAPALAVAAYALLLLAASRAFGVNGLPSAIPPPKWRNPRAKPRASTADLMNHLRFELWGKAIAATNFSHFVNHSTPPTTREKHLPNLATTLFYAQQRA